MWWIDILIGTLTGILSGFGIGGGTLLMLWLTLVGGIGQLQAAGINLLYFIFSAVPALVTHIKNKLVDKTAWLYCLLGGIPSCLAAAFLASYIDGNWLKKGFGLLLLYIGLRELFAPKTLEKKQ